MKNKFTVLSLCAAFGAILACNQTPETSAPVAETIAARERAPRPGFSFAAREITEEEYKKITGDIDRMIADMEKIPEQTNPTFRVR